jgi:hypothetical protein
MSRCDNQNYFLTVLKVRKGREGEEHCPWVRTIVLCEKSSSGSLPLARMRMVHRDKNVGYGV